MILVKIIKSSQPDFWYNDRIGETFGVDTLDPKEHELPKVIWGAKGELLFVIPSDVIPIDEWRKNKISELGI